MKNKTNLTKKVAKAFINIGTVHVRDCSIVGGYYEPKISMDLLKDNKEISK